MKAIKKWLNPSTEEYVLTETELFVLPRPLHDSDNSKPVNLKKYIYNEKM